jgi:predicted DCC family thiol-disulfide oxidoreductase YuxK
VNLSPEEARDRARAHEGVLMFYDGVCGLCDHAVQFLLTRDEKKRILFAALQSDFAGEVLRRHGRNPEALDSMILVRDYGRSDETLLDKTAAAFGAARELGGAWGVLARLGLCFPAFLRDPVYRLIARARYRLFGKFETCRLPRAEERARFLA